MIKRILGEITYKRIENNLNKEIKKLEKELNKKGCTVVCKYCGQLLPRKDAGIMWDVNEQQAHYFHEECFEQNENMGTLEDLKKENEK